MGVCLLWPNRIGHGRNSYIGDLHFRMEICFFAEIVNIVLIMHIWDFLVLVLS